MRVCESGAGCRAPVEKGGWDPADQDLKSAHSMGLTNWGTSSSRGFFQVLVSFQDYCEDGVTY